MKNNGTIRIIALVLSAVLVLAAALIFTGCGEDGDKNATAATQPAATAATAAPTQAATQSTNDAQNGSAQQTATTAASGGNSQIDSEGYLDENQAVQNALEQAGAGSYALSYYKGVAPDGGKAWVVTVQKPDGTTAVYYSGYLFCYLADSAAEEVDDGHGIFDVYFANVSEQDAGMIALNNIGEGWFIVSTYQGSYQGVDAWAIVLRNEESGTTRTAYVNGGDCYFG